MEFIAILCFLYALDLVDKGGNGAMVAVLLGIGVLFTVMSAFTD